MTRRTRVAQTSLQRFFSGSSVVASVLETKIKRRFPPSSAFIFRTACAVVPLPAKKSRMMSFLLAAIVRIREINEEGFGVEKDRAASGRRDCNSFLAESL